MGEREGCYQKKIIKLSKNFVFGGNQERIHWCRSRQHRKYQKIGSKSVLSARDIDQIAEDFGIGTNRTADPEARHDREISNEANGDAARRVVSPTYRAVPRY